jgi:uncharacterized protein involved in response to NO
MVNPTSSEIILLTYKKPIMIIGTRLAKIVIKPFFKPKKIVDNTNKVKNIGIATPLIAYLNKITTPSKYMQSRIIITLTLYGILVNKNVVITIGL